MLENPPGVFKYVNGAVTCLQDGIRFTGHARPVRPGLHRGLCDRLRVQTYLPEVFPLENVSLLAIVLLITIITDAQIIRTTKTTCM